MGYEGGYEGGYEPELTFPVERVRSAPGRPRLKLEMAFENFGQPLTWHDESAYVRKGSPGLDVKRGRSGELDDYNIGTAQLFLDNRDGRYDPDNVSGPYFGRLKSRRAVRISVEIGQGPQPFTLKRSWVGGDNVLKGSDRAITLMVGDSGSFNRSWGIEGRDATVSLDVTDYLARLDADVPTAKDPITNEVVPITVSGTTGDAVVQLLARFGWPGVSGSTAPLHNQFVDIDKGQQTLVDFVTVPAPGVPIEGKYLDALRKLALTEGGDFFASREGKLTFREADTLGAIAGVWGDTPAELPYHALTAKPADENIINEVTIEQSNGAKVTASDPVSIAEHGLETRTFQIYPVADVQFRALTMLQRYSQERERIVGFQPVGRREVGLWRTIFPREFGDQVPFQLHPVYGGVIDRTLRLEGTSIASPDGHDWIINWSASEVPQVNPNLLPDAQGDFEEGAHVWLPGTPDTQVSVFTPTGDIGPGSPMPPGHGVNVLRVTHEPSVSVPVNAYTDVELTLPGVTFQVGGYFFSRNSSASGVRFALEWLGPGDVVLQTDSVLIGFTSSQWAYKTFQTTCPPAGLTARLRYYSVSDASNLFLDSLFVRKI